MEKSELLVLASPTHLCPCEVTYIFQLKLLQAFSDPLHTSFGGGSEWEDHHVPCLFLADKLLMKVCLEVGEMVAV